MQQQRSTYTEQENLIQVCADSKFAGIRIQIISVTIISNLVLLFSSKRKDEEIIFYNKQLKQFLKGVSIHLLFKWLLTV